MLGHETEESCQGGPGLFSGDPRAPRRAPNFRARQWRPLNDADESLRMNVAFLPTASAPAVAACATG